MADIIISTVDRCIYCGATASDVELTQEHMIPLALGGTYIIENGSCVTCQKITMHIEQNVLRPMLGMARVRLNLRTRRPKERSSPFRVRITRQDHSEEIVEVFNEDIPAYLMLPRFEQPGLLVGRGPTEEIPLVAWWRCSFDSDPSGMLKSLEGKFGKGSVQLGYLRLDEFGRMLAKIAHATAVGKFGLDAFVPLLQPLIRKEDNEISLYVGTSLEEPKPIGKHVIIRLEWMDGPYGEFLIAFVWLFPLLGSPIYQIVVGRRPTA
jgi:hypothetical protein